MKKLLLFLACLPFIAQAQTDSLDFAPIGAKWYYTYDYNCVDKTPNTTYCEFYTVESKRDTLVKGQKAQILETEYYLVNGKKPKETHIVYGKKNGKVYKYDQNIQNFRLFYDFTLKKGDTLTIFSEPFDYQGNRYKCLIDIVDSVGSMLINGKVAKFFYVKNLHNPPLKDCNFSFTKTNGFFPIIEGIGSTMDLWGNYPYILTIDLKHSGLRCYEEKGRIIYKDKYFPYYCNYITDFIRDVEKSDYHTIKVFPNPTQDYISLDLPVIENCYEVNIQNIQGVKIFTHTFFTPQIKINIQTLQPALYFIQIRTNRTVFSSQFIKF